MIKFDISEITELKDFIRMGRAYKKISSTQLSEMVGKSRAYLSQIENGHNKNPDYDTMYKVFKFFEMNEEDINKTLNHYGIYSDEDISKYFKNKIKTKFLSKTDMEIINNRHKKDAESIAKELEDLNDISKRHLIES